MSKTTKTLVKAAFKQLGVDTNTRQAIFTNNFVFHDIVDKASKLLERHEKAALHTLAPTLKSGPARELASTIASAEGAQNVPPELPNELWARVHSFVGIPDLHQSVDTSQSFRGCTAALSQKLARNSLSRLAAADTAERRAQCLGLAAVLIESLPPIALKQATTTPGAQNLDFAPTLAVIAEACLQQPAEDAPSDVRCVERATRAAACRALRAIRKYLPVEDVDSLIDAAARAMPNTASAASTTRALQLLTVIAPVFTERQRARVSELIMSSQSLRSDHAQTQQLLLNLPAGDATTCQALVRQLDDPAIQDGVCWILAAWLPRLNETELSKVSAVLFSYLPSHALEGQGYKALLAALIRASLPQCAVEAWALLKRLPPMDIPNTIPLIEAVAELYPHLVKLHERGDFDEIAVLDRALGAAVQNCMDRPQANLRPLSHSDRDIRAQAMKGLRATLGETKFLDFCNVALKRHFMGYPAARAWAKEQLFGPSEQTSQTADIASSLQSSLDDPQENADDQDLRRSVIELVWVAAKLNAEEVKTTWRAAQIMAEKPLRDQGQQLAGHGIVCGLTAIDALTPRLPAQDLMELYASASPAVRLHMFAAHTPSDAIAWSPAQLDEIAQLATQNAAGADPVAGMDDGVSVEWTLHSQQVALDAIERLCQYVTPTDLERAFD